MWLQRQKACGGLRAGLWSPLLRCRHGDCASSSPSLRFALHVVPDCGWLPSWWERPGGTGNVWASADSPCLAWLVLGHLQTRQARPNAPLACASSPHASPCHPWASRGDLRDVTGVSGRQDKEGGGIPALTCWGAVPLLCIISAPAERVISCACEHSDGVVSHLDLSMVEVQDNPVTLDPPQSERRGWATWNEAWASSPHSPGRSAGTWLSRL